jgi:hypothetical protein
MPPTRIAPTRRKTVLVVKASRLKLAGEIEQDPQAITRRRGSHRSSPGRHRLSGRARGSDGDEQCGREPLNPPERAPDAPSNFFSADFG